MSSKSSLTSSGTKDLWAVVAERQKADKSGGPPSQIDVNVIFAGPKGSGKSTLVQRFIKKDDVQTKPTIALEYTYGRKEAKEGGGPTRIAHLWEIGGGASLGDLVDVVITPENIHTIVAVVVVDLSEPSEAFVSCLTWLNKVKSRVKDVMRVLEQAGSSAPGKLMKKSVKTFGESHPDLAKLDLCGVPIVIVATKYDAISVREVEELKVMFRALRYIAHTSGASIVCVSNKDDTMSKYRGLMSTLVFNEPQRDKTQADHTKPLLIVAGKDSLDSIGSPVAITTRTTIAVPPMVSALGDPLLARWFLPFAAVFPPKSQSSEKKDPFENMDQFREPAVDAMRQQKDEEFAAFKKAAEKSGREGGSGRSEVAAQ